MYSIIPTSFTVKGLIKRMDGVKGVDKLTFKCPVQRGIVWDIGRQSLLVHSLLTEDLIPELILRRIPNENGSGYILEGRDGQQRCTAAYKFVKGEFKIKNIPAYHDGDKLDFRLPRGKKGELEDINGLGWDDLTDEERETIKDKTLRLVYIDNATDAEADRLFFKLNNGKALTNAEQFRTQARSRDTIKHLGYHEIFTKMFSEKAIINGAFDTVSKVYCMLTEDEPNLMSPHIKDLIKNTDITEDDSDLIKKVLDFINTVHSAVSVNIIAKRMIKKTHFLSLIPIVYKAMEDDLNPALFVKFIEEFYDGKSTKEPTISDAYNNNFLDGSASRAKIRVRHNALMNHYEKMYNGEKEDIYSTDINEFKEEPVDEITENDMKGGDKSTTKTKKGGKKEKGLNYDSIYDLSNSPTIQNTAIITPETMNLPQETEYNTYTD